jgi:hypothetical protein
MSLSRKERFMKVLVRLMLVSLLSVLGVTALGASEQASAVPCGAPCAPPVTTYTVVSLNTYPNTTLLHLGRVGSCSNPGGKCTLSITNSVSTTVEASFGLSHSWVSGHIGVSLSSSSSVGVTAVSPRKLTANEQFRAYANGVQKQYRIKKTVSSYYGTTTETSGWLYAYEPYRNSFDFGIYAI